MYDHLELAYLGIQVPEPSSLDAFFGDVIGLMPGTPVGATTHTWRDDAKVHRLLVEAGDANDASFVGFEATDDAAFDAVAELIRSSGHETGWMSCSTGAVAPTTTILSRKLRM